MRRDHPMTDNPRSLKKISGGAVTLVGGGLIVGRSAECGLRLTEGSPSRQHARLVVEGDQLWVEDLGSTNGSFVNGVLAAAATDVPVLSVSSGAGTAGRLELKATGGDKQEWSIGSDAARELCLPVSGVSALHARIVRDGERWKVIDQVSANGTYVNGKRCTMSFLNSGDRVAFGPVECSFVLPDRVAVGDQASAGGEAAMRRGGWSVGRIVTIGAVSFVLTLVVVYLLMKLASRGRGSAVA